MFEGVKFGDRFVTRDGRIAVLIGILYNEFVIHLSDGNYHIFSTDSYGKNMFNSQLDIVSCYKKPIDEDKLDELAYNNMPLDWGDCQEHGFGTGDYESAEDHSEERECFIEGFKVGYKQAMEE